MVTSICMVCGKPLIDHNDLAARTPKGNFCKDCVDANGQVKSFETKVSEMAKLLATSTMCSMQEATAKAEKNLRKLPYWKNEFLRMSS